jgi:hypothetical protein
MRRDNNTFSSDSGSLVVGLAYVSVLVVGGRRCQLGPEGEGCRSPLWPSDEVLRLLQVEALGERDPRVYLGQTCSKEFFFFFFFVPFWPPAFLNTRISSLPLPPILDFS